MTEEWTDIKGYEGLYQISNCGRVKSLPRNGTINAERILKSAINRGGYNTVILVKQGKYRTHFVHRLVAQAFIPNPDELPQINHKDENKLNNKVENLEWCTSKYNVNYGTRNERASKPVQCIETGVIYKSAIEAEKKTGSCSRHIAHVCKGKRKTTNGYHWKYVEKECDNNVH